MRERNSRQENSFFNYASFYNNAIFAGGTDNEGVGASNNVDIYNSSLVKETFTNFSPGREAAAGAVVGEYVLFAGGQYVAKVNAYTASTPPRKCILIPETKIYI